jgi:hypothetical protein
MTLFASLVGFVVGGGVRSPTAEAKRARGGKAAPVGSVDCKSDKDCALVADDCCSCSQGGKQHAIPKKEKDAYEKDRKKRCKETQCIDMMSQDPTCTQQPFCAAGICELGDAPATGAH